MFVVLAVFASASTLANPLAPPGPTAVGVNVNAEAEQKLNKFWQASVGSGHAALGLRKDWQAQLKAVRDDTGIKGVRFHGTFDDDMGPVVDEHGVYNWTLVDDLYDAIIAAGVKPIVELSFMPSAIANCTMPHCRTDMYYRGVIVPPRSWGDWYALVAAFVAHLVERHGLAEVVQWRFEVWNEMWGMPWGNGATGKAEDSPYMALYNASHHAIKAVSPSLSVGGPATEEVMHVGDFLAALKAWGLPSGPPDFVSTHSYPTDTCNSQPDARTHLDCFTDAIIAAREQAAGHTFLMTEYNCGWKNSAIHDGESKAYAASFLFRTVNSLRMHDISALSWWTFSSIFEEGGLPTNEFGPFGANSAMQSVHGVPMPIYRGFELLKDAGDVVLPTTISVGGTATTTTTMVASSGGGVAPPTGSASSSSSSSGSSAYNQSTDPLSTFVTKNTTSNVLHVFLANFAPDDGRKAGPPTPEEKAERQMLQTVGVVVGGGAPRQQLQPGAGIVLGINGTLGDTGVCYKMVPNPCTESSCYLTDTDFGGDDLLPESQKFKTDTPAACCAACAAYKPDKFCEAWVWATGAIKKDPHRCYLKAAAAMPTKKHSKGMVAGYPQGIAPPDGGKPWYTVSRTVVYTFTGAKADSSSTNGESKPTVAIVKMINSTCANPKDYWTNQLNSTTWPTAPQLAALETVSKLCEETVPVTWSAAGEATVEITLEAYAAAELILPLP